MTSLTHTSALCSPGACLRLKAFTTYAGRHLGRCGMGYLVLRAPPVRARRAGTEDPSTHDGLDRPGSADRELGRSRQPAARLTSARRRAGRSSSLTMDW